MRQIPTTIELLHQNVLTLPKMRQISSTIVLLHQNVLMFPKMRQIPWEYSYLWPGKKLDPSTERIEGRRLPPTQS